VEPKEESSVPTPADLLADRAAIIDVLYRYATALDSGRWDLLADVFTPSAPIQVSAGTFQGPAEMRAAVAPYLAQLAACQHIITNPQIELEGDSATSRCYLHAIHYMPDQRVGGNTLERGGVYHDRWVRTADGWRITARRLEVTWTDGNSGIEAEGRRRTAT
jgi:3-phenylpropionate/cinnamic acid dioxygenase small subunit